MATTATMSPVFPVTEVMVVYTVLFKPPLAPDKKEIVISKKISEDTIKVLKLHLRGSFRIIAKKTEDFFCKIVKFILLSKKNDFIYFEFYT